MKIVLGCLLSLCFLGSLTSTVQAQSSEYQVKAAFLYNFAKFVDWPGDALGNSNAPLIIGVMGDDPFGGALDQAISGKTINGRSLQVRRLRWGHDLRSCHILFISSSERKRLPQIIQSLRGASVLTVGDMGQFNQQGGIINFILEANKVRFEINSRGADQARLKISSKLLSLAKNR
ncbi:MAG TPA: YfiR family protein [Pyrinomonadaceae bacterium]